MTSLELTNIESLSTKLWELGAISAVEIVVGSRTVVRGNPVGPPRGMWSLSTTVKVSVWGDQLAAVDAVLDLARLVDLREQEIADLTEALTQANDRQLRLYELSRMTIEVLERDPTVVAMLGHGIELLSSHEGVLVGSSGYLSAQGFDHESDDELLTLAKSALVNPKSARMVRLDDRNVLLSRFAVEDTDYVLAIGRRDHAFGTAERKTMDALARTMASSLRVVAMHRSAVENEVIEHEHNTAARLAAAVMPDDLQRVDGIDAHAVSTPARSVGGDFYTSVADKNSLRFAVGDVTGKGLPAAVLMTNAITVSNLVFRQSGTDCPGRLLHDISEGLDSLLRGTNRFITMLVGVARYDRRTGQVNVAIANAGHSPVLLLADGKVRALSPMSPPIGVVAPVGEPTRLLLNPGDSLLVGSDGLTEQENEFGEMFGEERVGRLLKPGRSAHQNMQNILTAVSGFAGATPRSDDQTILVLQPGNGD